MEDKVRKMCKVKEEEGKKTLKKLEEIQLSEQKNMIELRRRIQD